MSSTNPDPACSAGFDWMNNGKGQNPCEVTGWIISLCNGGSSAAPIPTLTSPSYNPPDSNSETTCTWHARRVRIIHHKVGRFSHQAATSRDFHRRQVIGLKVYRSTVTLPFHNGPLSTQRHGIVKRLKLTRLKQ
ncbi:hypothetical protein SCHPADRAFT_618056 [Schizopora paradoxa]|uniref:Uncharacterized protein n=1 Tax=Schizopora paradoxa TaxID=27342 RepID=A0A0H2R9X7_9AGAM|nr:hypothetical protein SCHPADRAFT_618056 [Schizopora paradoxa]